MPGKLPPAPPAAPEDPGDDQVPLNAKYIADFPGLVELVEDKGKCVFLIKVGDKLTLSPTAKVGGTEYHAPPIERVPWGLPNAQNVMKHYKDMSLPVGRYHEIKALFYDIVEHLKKVSELPSQEHYYLLAAWCMHTYLIEKFDYSPILFLYAVPERGKSRTGKGIINISRRGLHVESLREPYLFRASNDLVAAIFFDITDVNKALEKSGSEDILLGRFERGIKVPRVLRPDQGAFKDTEYFKVFGPSIIGSNQPLSDALESRTIMIQMPATTKQFENPVTPEAGMELKERLVAFRAHLLNKNLPSIPKPALARAGDLFKPLVQVIELVAKERLDEFRDLIKVMVSAQQFQKSESFEAKVIRAVATLEPEVKSGQLPVKDITDEVNRDMREKYNSSPQRVGRTLNSLGFGKRKTANGSSAIIFDPAQLKKLMKTYGVTLAATSSSDTPDTQDIDGPFPTPKNATKKIRLKIKTGVSGESEGSKLDLSSKLPRNRVLKLKIKS
jgi:hypothetical protein